MQKKINTNAIVDMLLQLIPIILSQCLSPAAVGQQIQSKLTFTATHTIFLSFAVPTGIHRQVRTEKPSCRNSQEGH